MRRPDGRGAQAISELHFVQLMIAAQQNQAPGLVWPLRVATIDQRLNLTIRRRAAGKCDQVFNRAHARRGKLFRRSRSGFVR